MPHDHDHHHARLPEGDRRVVAAVVVNLGLTVVQIVAGVISGSLAMIADAIHNLSDALSLMIALVARKLARRPADESMTFGYGRIEVVAALVNYTTLIVIALWLLAEGLHRLFDPVPVQGWIVVIVASVALVIDLVTALLIFRLSRDSMNMRAAFLHNLADAMGSLAVILGGTLILLYDWRLIDPVLTIVIAGYILWHAGRGMVPAVRLLMLGSPDSPRLPEVIDALRAIPGIADLHHLHLWRMQEHDSALEAHVVLDNTRPASLVRADMKALLHDRFAITHSTIELESPDEACRNAPLIGH
ncbi:MAG: cation diffusion facilitator family transporter [Paracoccaceae bacterium]|nr:cation diffusion facilitator family transporter [Paracoccaceae bacterium]